MSTENVNLLSQQEWRFIHNALAARQSESFQSAVSRQAIQVLMNKVRDNYIESDVEDEPERDYTGSWIDHATDAERNV